MTRGGRTRSMRRLWVGSAAIVASTVGLGTSATSAVTDLPTTSVVASDADPGPAFVQGNVTDADSGSPVGGVLVLLSSDAAPHGPVAVVTNSSGFYVFAGMPPAADYVLEFRSANYANEFYDEADSKASATRFAVAAGETVVIDESLSGGGAIEGTVRSASGAGLDGIEVVACVVVPTSCASTATTAADGTYRVGGLEGGDYLVRFSDPTGAHAAEYYDDVAFSFAATSVPVTFGETTPDIDAVLDVPVRIFGVLTGGGTPLAGAEVQLSSSLGTTSDTTDANGAFAFDGLRPDTYTVQYGSPDTNVYIGEYWQDAATALEATPIVAAPGDEIDVSASLSRWSFLRGTVTDASGGPIAGAVVSACPEAEVVCSNTSTTDGSGAYELRVAPGPGYLVELESPGTFVGEWWCDVESRDAAIRLVVGDGVTIEELDASLRGVGAVDHDTCDVDDDGVLDPVDNCPTIANTSQANLDGDGLGDACDPDDDNDGVSDGVDNCPTIINTDQANLDGDGLGDACDPDDDNDAVNDTADNCPRNANPSQADADDDGIGDVCDPTPNPPAPNPPNPPNPPAPDPAVFVSSAPSRFLDNRPTGDTFDDANQGGGRTPAGGREVVQIAGRGNVPADATAVVMNLTAVNALGTGWATAHPCLPTAPLASSVNFRTGGLEPNEIIVKLDSQGSVCIDVAGADTFLIADIVGYTLPDSAYTPINPTRYTDTRPTGQTFDDNDQAFGPITPGTTVEIPIAGRGAVPATATAAALNLTVTQGQDTGFATVHPCLTPTPNTSSINYRAGDNRPNEVIAELSPRGTVCITVGDATTHLIVDVVGHLTPTTTYTTVGPTRIVDTRPLGDTIDEQNQATGLVQPGQTYRVQITGRAGVPSTATQATINLTVVTTQNTGFATVHPCQPIPPTASSINYFTGTIRPNELITQLDPRGGTCITIGDAATNLIVDITAHNG